MRFYNYLINETISTNKIEQILSNHMNIISERLADLDNPKNATKIIREELKKAAERVLYQVEGITKLSKIKGRVFKKQKSKKCSGRTNYQTIDSFEGVGRFEFWVEIGEYALDAALYDKEVKPKVLKLINEIMFHEIVHLIQWYRSKGKLADGKSYYGDGKEASWKPKDKEGFKVYLAYPEEIGAYAAESALEVLKHKDINNEKISPEKLLKSIHDKEIIEYLANISRVFNNYYEYFGKNKDNKLAQKVWKKFIKEFVYHIREKI